MQEGPFKTGAGSERDRLLGLRYRCFVAFSRTAHPNDLTLDFTLSFTIDGQTDGQIDRQKL